MPHLHLETTADLPENVDIPDILEALCSDLIRHPKVDSSKTRAYHTLRSVWYVGADARPGFVHLTVSILPGRDPEWKRQVGRSLLSVLDESFQSSVLAGETSITIELREMATEGYFRIP
jgi:5-carboxymethyl-2-hydroxymuconate isomerase